MIAGWFHRLKKHPNHSKSLKYGERIHPDMTDSMLKWGYDNYSTYSSVCPNTGWELRIQRVRVRAVRNVWVIFVNGEEYSNKRRYSDAQRAIENWVSEGSMESRLTLV